MLLRISFECLGPEMYFGFYDWPWANLVAAAVALAISCALMSGAAHWHAPMVSICCHAPFGVAEEDAPNRSYE